VLREILEPFRPAVAGQVGRAGAQDPAIGGKPARDETRILEVRDSDREIEPLADDVDQGVGQNEVHRDGLIGLQELVQVGRNVQPPEGGRR
jgi:hypothetical protein